MVYDTLYKIYKHYIHNTIYNNVYKFKFIFSYRHNIPKNLSHHFKPAISSSMKLDVIFQELNVL